MDDFVHRFIDFIVGPQFTEFGRLLTDLDETFQGNIKANKDHWEDEEVVEETTGAITKWGSTSS